MHVAILVEHDAYAPLSPREEGFGQGGSAAPPRLIQPGGLVGEVEAVGLGGRERDGVRGDRLDQEGRESNRMGGSSDSSKSRYRERR